MFEYELDARSETGARAGVFRTPHGDVPTPAFMPVGTRATVKALAVSDLRQCGAAFGQQIVIIDGDQDIVFLEMITLGTGEQFYTPGNLRRQRHLLERHHRSTQGNGTGGSAGLHGHDLRPLGGTTLRPYTVTEAGE